ncbi:GcrA family cell cycle regulator [Kaistia sp. MMO-174]|uniref:GcrA family cell cycle regulator n=1 Tax=Kaistia sp. MMO-174 TaxID=3081256 RepID=UPI0030177F00
MARWTEEQIDEVRRLYAEGKSARQISETIAGGFSRNAICGVIDRHRMIRRAGASVPVPGRRVRPQNSGKKKGQKNGPDVTKAIKVTEQRPEVAPSANPPEARPTFDLEMLTDFQAGRAVSEYGLGKGPRPLSMLALFDCRYVISGEGIDALFCGATARVGSSYCDDHHQRCYLKSRSPSREG